MNDLFKTKEFNHQLKMRMELKENMLVKNVILWDQTKRKDEFSNMDRLHHHKKQHNQFQCDQCIFKSSTKEEVSDHVKRMHVIKRK